MICPACGSDRLRHESPFRTVCADCGAVVKDDPMPKHWPVRQLILQHIPPGAENALTASEIAEQIVGASPSSVAQHIRGMRGSEEYPPVEQVGGVRLRYHVREQA